MKYNDTSSQLLVERNQTSLVPCASIPTKGKLVTICDEVFIDPVITWLDVDQQWAKTKGEEIKIAVLDSGVATHDNLEGAVVEAVDFTGSTAGAVDVQGHGTHVIGIIAAREKPTGVIGVAPQALIYSAKVLDDGGDSKVQAFIDGINWAISKKVHIISISLVCSPTNEVLEAAVARAIEAGIFVLSAVGNNGQEKQAVYPASYEGVIAIGAVDIDGNIAKYSNKGTYVDFVAPGKLISTYLNNQYVEWEGTSMAVAYTTGVVALLLALHLKNYKSSLIKTAQELKYHLISSSIDLGRIGKDEMYGFGLVDPQQVLLTGKYDCHIAKGRKNSQQLL